MKSLAFLTASRETRNNRLNVSKHSSHISMLETKITAVKAFNIQAQYKLNKT